MKWMFMCYRIVYSTIHKCQMPNNKSHYSVYLYKHKHNGPVYVMTEDVINKHSQFNFKFNHTIFFLSKSIELWILFKIRLPGIYIWALTNTNSVYAQFKLLENFSSNFFWLIHTSCVVTHYKVYICIVYYDFMILIKFAM